MTSEGGEGYLEFAEMSEVTPLLSLSLLFFLLPHFPFYICGCMLVKSLSLKLPRSMGHSGEKLNIIRDHERERETETGRQRERERERDRARERKRPRRE